VVYAGAMAAEAVAALATGDLFDRYGGPVLLVVPLVVAAVPPLVFAPILWPVIAGVALWGAASGIQDSTVKAYVADLVPPRWRSTGWAPPDSYTPGRCLRRLWTEMAGSTTAGLWWSRTGPAGVRACAMLEATRPGRTSRTAAAQYSSGVQQRQHTQQAGCCL
jgi:MFS family permease